MKLEVRQGTNNAWFIYKDNKVILGSHDKEIIDKCKDFLSKKECKCNYEHYTNEYGETVAVCPKCMDAYF